MSSLLRLNLKPLLLDTDINKYYEVGFECFGPDLYFWRDLKTSSNDGLHVFSRVANYSELYVCIMHEHDGGADVGFYGEISVVDLRDLLLILAKLDDLGYHVPSLFDDIASGHADKESTLLKLKNLKGVRFDGACPDMEGLGGFMYLQTFYKEEFKV